MERYQNIIANSNTGLPVNGAQVYVLNYGTSTQATIYSDDGITTVAQPLQTNSLGSFYFYAANGHYTINIYYNAALVGSLPDVLLQDAADPLTVDITGGTINNTTIGATTPSSGDFTTASISGGSIGSVTISASTIDNSAIGGTTPAAGSFTTVTTPGLAATGGSIDGTVIGGTTPAAGTFAAMTASTVSASSYNGGALAGARNLIINGNFQINQRGVSGSVVLTAGSYGHDRWKGGASGATYTFSTSGVDTTLTISAGSIVHVIEGANVAGTSYLLSWTGTAQARFNGGTYASSPIAISGITAGSNLTIEFNTGTVGLVQVEPGSTATPFERVRYNSMLEACQRYYIQYQGTGTAGYYAAMSQNQTTTSVAACFTFPVSMRSSPTPAISGNVRVEVNGASQIISLSTPNVSSSNTARVSFTGTGLTVGQAGAIRLDATTDIISFTAEL